MRVSGHEERLANDLKRKGIEDQPLFERAQEYCGAVEPDRVLGADLGAHLGAVSASEGGDTQAQWVKNDVGTTLSGEIQAQLDAHGVDDGGASTSTAVFRIKSPERTCSGNRRKIAAVI